MQRNISVIGLGYVGLPVAVAFGQVGRVIGFDISSARIADLKQHFDKTGEVTREQLASADILLTHDAKDLQAADFHIIAVPTPVDSAHQPDLTPVKSASELLAPHLKQGDIVVFESTVYPGVTEEICLPILEKRSGLRGGVDFFVGYSPERINPGDREHVFTKIRKVVAAQTPEALEIVAQVYGSVVTAGVFRAASIRVAEAAKVIENTQRDLNIALMNELALLFNKMDLDTLDVLAAAETKWNFLPFRPGLVGGHCIGVDPYYLTHKAEQLGYIPQVILAGRRINDGMGRFIAEQAVKRMIHAGVSILGSRVTILGLTFKENCPDLRNSRVVDVVRELQDFGVEVQLCDPVADAAEVAQEYGVAPVALADLAPADAVIVAVAHAEFRRLAPQALRALFKDNRCVLLDVKGIYPRETLADFDLWRL